MLLDFWPSQTNLDRCRVDNSRRDDFSGLRISHADGITNTSLLQCFGAQQGNRQLPFASNQHDPVARPNQDARLGLLYLVQIRTQDNSSGRQTSTRTLSHHIPGKLGCLAPRYSPSFQAYGV